MISPTGQLPIRSCRPSIRIGGTKFKEESGGGEIEGEGGMDGESESPLIRATGLSGQWDNRICARACARGRRRGFWGSAETRICSSKRAASRSACKLPSSFCGPALYPFTSVGGRLRRLHRMHPGPEIRSRPVSMVESLTYSYKIVGFQELQDGGGFNPSSARYCCNPLRRPVVFAVAASDASRACAFSLGSLASNLIIR